MYRYFVLLIMIISLSPAFASRTVVTQRPYNNYFHTPQAYLGGDYVPGRRYNRHSVSMFSDINELERYAMNRNYARDNDYRRLERLEMQAFGAVQQGDTLTRYNNVRNAILTRPKQNYRKSFFRSLNDYFGGELTGFTPSLSGNSFGQIYDNSYSSPWGGGYSNYSYGQGSGLGITRINN